MKNTDIFKMAALFTLSFLISNCGKDSEMTDATNKDGTMGSSVKVNGVSCNQNSSCQQQCNSWFQFEDEKAIDAEYNLKGLLNSGAHHKALQENQEMRDNYYSCLDLPLREVISQPSSETRSFFSSNLCKNVMRCSQSCVDQYPFRDPSEIDRYYNAMGLRGSGAALKAHQENDIIYNNFLNCLERKAIEVIEP